MASAWLASTGAVVNMHKLRAYIVHYDFEALQPMFHASVTVGA